jgi:hypothetical protein
MSVPLQKCIDNGHMSNADLDRFSMGLSRAVGGPFGALITHPPAAQCACFFLGGGLHHHLLIYVAASYTRPHEVPPTSSELRLVSLSKVYRLHAKQAEKRGPLAIPWRVTWRGMKIGHVVYPSARELAGGFLPGLRRHMVTRVSTLNRGLEHL